MPDPLGKLRSLANRLDRERARPSRIEPERLILADRPAAFTRKICWDCRRVPEEAMFAEYHRKWEAASGEERANLPWWRELVGESCPACGGRLVEITA